MRKNSCVLTGACCAMAMAMMLSGCRTTSEVTYLQDLQPNVTLQLQAANDIKFKPGDRIGIGIHSRDKELSSIFNLNNGTTPNTGNNTGETTLSGNNFMSSYIVENDSCIEMPLLGQVKAAGLTRYGLSREIKQRLIKSGLLTDPVVTVNYGDLGVSVTGEVNRPGRVAIDRDRMTLLDALVLAGDLTIHGKRDNVLVLRTENGLQTPYRVDLTKTESLYSSPAYYLQQNDVIYVEPASMKANEQKPNANLARSATFWVSIASLATTIIAILVR